MEILIMAKVTNPLLSMDASGSVGSALTFSNWKGRSVVRGYTVPSNPKSAAQAVVRNAFRVVAEIQKHINRSIKIQAGQTLTDKKRIQDATPSGYAWNGFIVEQATGPAQSAFLAAAAAYAALAAGAKTAWNDAAIASVPPYAPVVQLGALDAPAPAISAGQVFFHKQMALASAGVATLPGAVPPVYA
jgi:hypothetical protein